MGLQKQELSSNTFYGLKLDQHTEPGQQTTQTNLFLKLCFLCCATNKSEIWASTGRVQAPGVQPPYNTQHIC